MWSWRNSYWWIAIRKIFMKESVIECDSKKSSSENIDISKVDVVKFAALEKVVTECPAHAKRMKMKLPLQWQNLTLDNLSVADKEIYMYRMTKQSPSLAWFQEMLRMTKSKFFIISIYHDWQGTRIKQHGINYSPIVFESVRGIVQSVTDLYIVEESSKKPAAKASASHVQEVKKYHGS